MFTLDELIILQHHSNRFVNGFGSMEGECDEYDIALLKKIKQEIDIMTKGQQYQPQGLRDADYKEVSS